MEQMDYDLLFRWFVGLAMDAPVWDFTVTEQRAHTRPPIWKHSLSHIDGNNQWPSL